jgi:hypothetical protein
VDSCEQDVLAPLAPDQPRRGRTRQPVLDPVEEEPARDVFLSTRSSRDISPPFDEKGEVLRNVQGREMVVDLRLGKQRWRFLIRLYLKQPGGVLYVLRAYARAEVFERVEPELIKALDSFQLHQTP